MQTGDGGSEEARAAKRGAMMVEAPCYPRVVELPREVVEKLLPLVPACTLCARARCAGSGRRMRVTQAHVEAGAVEGRGRAYGEGGDTPGGEEAREEEDMSYASMPAGGNIRTPA